MACDLVRWILAKIARVDCVLSIAYFKPLPVAKTAKERDCIISHGAAKFLKDASTHSGNFHLLMPARGTTL